MGQTTTSFIKGASQMKFEPNKPANFTPSSDMTTASSKTTNKFFEPNENRSVFENVMNKVFSFGGITSVSYDNNQKGHKQ